jgi:hypothetical protein
MIRYIACWTENMSCGCCTDNAGMKSFVDVTEAIKQTREMLGEFIIETPERPWSEELMQQCAGELAARGWFQMEDKRGIMNAYINRLDIL